MPKPFPTKIHSAYVADFRLAQWFDFFKNHNPDTFIIEEDRVMAKKALEDPLHRLELFHYIHSIIEAKNRGKNQESHGHTFNDSIQSQAQAGFIALSKGQSYQPEEDYVKFSNAPSSCSYAYVNDQGHLLINQDGETLRGGEVLSLLQKYGIKGSDQEDNISIVLNTEGYCVLKRGKTGKETNITAPEAKRLGSKILEKLANKITPQSGASLLFMVQAYDKAGKPAGICEYYKNIASQNNRTAEIVEIDEITQPLKKVIEFIKGHKNLDKEQKKIIIHLINSCIDEVPRYLTPLTPKVLDTRNRAEDRDLSKDFKILADFIINAYHENDKYNTQILEPARKGTGLPTSRYTNWNRLVDHVTNESRLKKESYMQDFILTKNKLQDALDNNIREYNEYTANQAIPFTISLLDDNFKEISEHEKPTFLLFSSKEDGKGFLYKKEINEFGVFYKALAVYEKIVDKLLSEKYGAAVNDNIPCQLYRSLIKEYGPKRFGDVFNESSILKFLLTKLNLAIQAHGEISTEDKEFFENNLINAPHLAFNGQLLTITNPLNGSTEIECTTNLNCDKTQNQYKLEGVISNDMQGYLEIIANPDESQYIFGQPGRNDLTGNHTYLCAENLSKAITNFTKTQVNNVNQNTVKKLAFFALTTFFFQGGILQSCSSHIQNVHDDCFGSHGDSSKNNFMFFEQKDNVLTLKMLYLTNSEFMHSPSYLHLTNIRLAMEVSISVDITAKDPQFLMKQRAEMREAPECRPEHFFEYRLQISNNNNNNNATSSGSSSKSSPFKFK